MEICSTFYSTSLLRFFLYTPCSSIYRKFSNVPKETPTPPPGDTLYKINCLLPPPPPPPPNFFMSKRKFSFWLLSIKTSWVKYNHSPKKKCLKFRPFGSGWINEWFILVQQQKNQQNIAWNDEHNYQWRIFLYWNWGWRNKCKDDHCRYSCNLCIY